MLCSQLGIKTAQQQFIAFKMHCKAAHINNCLRKARFIVFLEYTSICMFFL